jgi:hypothetical protein
MTWRVVIELDVETRPTPASLQAWAEALGSEVTYYRDDDGDMPYFRNEVRVHAPTELVVSS